MSLYKLILKSLPHCGKYNTELNMPLEISIEVGDDDFPHDESP
jgi:hypothetical protein